MAFLKPEDIIFTQPPAPAMAKQKYFEIQKDTARLAQTEKLVEEVVC